MIIHLGGNDLIVADEFSFRQRLVLSRRASLLFPHASLIWSDLLPRLYYLGARSPEGTEEKRRTLNRWAQPKDSWFGIRNLHLPQFRWTEATLYRFDAVHLSPLGNRIFRDNVYKAHSAFL